MRYLLAVLVLFGVACGSDDADNSEATVTTAPDISDATTPDTTVEDTVADSTDTTAADTVTDTSGPTDTTTADTMAETATAVSGEIVVFAAASLTDVFADVGAAFEAANPDTTITFNFAGSSELAAQINEGAPVDVFASANQNNMDKIEVPGEIFAVNKSVIVVAEGNPLGIEGVEDLGDDSLTLVVCAPDVPCGDYATEIFANADVTVTPDSLEQNVRAVVTKVELGEADAGIGYATDVEVADVDGVAIPDDINVVADYPIAVTPEAGNTEGAAAFVEFVLSDAGQEILNGYGFTSP